MKANAFVTEVLIATSLLGYPGWARPTQAPGEHHDSSTASPPENPASDTSTMETKISAKEKHWSGNLVDVGCMVKALGQRTGAANPNVAPGPHAPHFLGSGAPSPQAGQASGGVGSSPSPGANGPTPGAESPQDEERLAQVARVDNAAKKCAATHSTRTFGLATSDGQMFRFDPRGNMKASEALKGTPVDPGKRVKARVAGTMEKSSTINVASVDIKGKGKRSSKE